MTQFRPRVYEFRYYLNGDEVAAWRDKESAEVIPLLDARAVADGMNSDLQDLAPGDVVEVSVAYAETPLVPLSWALYEVPAPGVPAIHIANGGG